MVLLKVVFSVLQVYRDVGDAPKVGAAPETGNNKEPPTGLQVYISSILTQEALPTLLWRGGWGILGQQFLLLQLGLLIFQ